MLFGKSYWELHRKIDMPYIYLGRRHRVLFHDGFSSAMIARELYPGDPHAEEAALVHVQLDMLCSNDPFFKKQLYYFADVDARKRSRARKENARLKKRKKPKKREAYNDPLKDFQKLLKKLMEIKRLANMFSS
jgi:hypothetical protein